MKKDQIYGKQIKTPKRFAKNRNRNIFITILFMLKYSPLYKLDRKKSKKCQMQYGNVKSKEKYKTKDK